MDFQHLIEKIKNPLRKESLKGTTPQMGDFKTKAIEWKDHVLNGDLKDSPDLFQIRTTYLDYKRRFPDRADKWLDTLAERYANQFKKTKTAQYKRILDIYGFQVFVDDLVDPNFSEQPFNLHILNKNIQKLLLKSRGILPHRSVKIIITDKNKNEKFRNLYSSNPPAIEHDRLIYIDQYHVDDFDVLLHEYAHYVADLIPSQTEPLLQRGYEELLDIYWKHAKKKRRSLQPNDMSDSKSVQEIASLRKKISLKLGFPEYGLMNFHEFFAVLMESWITDNPEKRLPNNRATYKFKQLVKSVLSRL